MVMDDIRAQPPARAGDDAEPATGVDVRLESAAGSPISFADLYAVEFVPMVRLATLLVSRQDVARDIVQDAFVGLHVRWAGVRDPHAYLRRSVVNGCRSHHRREARRRRRAATVAAGEPSAELDVDHTLTTLDTLPPKQRAIVVLKFYEGRSEREIADIVGCRPGSVGPTLQRALITLRAEQE